MKSNALSIAEVEETVERTAKDRGQTASDFRKYANKHHPFILGEPDEIVEQLRKFKEVGIDIFFLVFSDDNGIRPLGIFRDKIIPRLR